MRRTPVLIAAGALALALPLAACGGDDGAATATTTASDNGVTVHAKDTLKFDATAYSAKAGKIDVTYVNDGGQAHTLLIKDHGGFKLSIGKEDDGTVDLQPGKYTLYCDIAGHEAAGMVAELTVT
jgi:plastocyanin